MEAPSPLTPRLPQFNSYALLGIAVEDRHLIAARLHVEGYGLESRIESAEGCIEPLSEEVAAFFAQRNSGSCSLSEYAAVQAALTSQSISLAQKLAVAEGGELPISIGVWERTCDLANEQENRWHLPLVDPAALAEATGLSVIDAFPARDIACGGRGEPLDALPLWFMLHDARRARLVVHSNGGVINRWSYLPASCEASGAARVLVGCRAAEERSTPLESSAEQAQWLLGEVHERIPRHPPLGEIVFTSPTDESGAIRACLAEQLADVRITTLDELGIESSWHSGRIAAILAFLHLLQTPANGTHLTGAGAARVLGSLTPGTPLHWRRLLKSIAEHQPATMSLRSAI